MVNESERLGLMVCCAKSKPECRQQSGDGYVALMCLTRGGIGGHDMYSLVLDDELIFTLTDDFSDDVRLKHTIPPGPVIEHPLSLKAGSKIVEIVGGCVPVSKNNMEVARVCNFTFGKEQIVKDVHFEF